jgi:acetoin utilization deacetylase AcuC-like enzyme
LARLEPRAASRLELERVHAPAYLAALEAQVAHGAGHLDPDTYFSPGSWDAALFAAGGAIEVTLATLAGEVSHAAVLARPPGHHATSARAMGFCLLNNVAAAAAAARAAGAPRVAIVDWDVHHGNGTQEIFWRDPDVLYVSTHQYPFYPGTGASDEIGADAGRGYTINVPMPAGMGHDEYLYAFDRLIMPALVAYEPTIVLVSAGYDAHRDDPLAEMRLETRTYAAIAARLRTLGRPLVVALEGGYDLAAVGACTAATVDVLATAAPPAPPERGAAASCAPAATRACADTARALSGTPLGQAVRPACAR